jgi:hypothetical protein
MARTTVAILLAALLGAAGGCDDEREYYPPVDGDGDADGDTDGDGDGDECAAVPCPRGEGDDGAGRCVPLAVTGTREVAVSFPGGDGDLTLAGTMTFPVAGAACRFPAVVLVHGSGPASRDESSSGQLMMSFGFTVHVFAEIAAALARAGYAVLRYDKRTCFAGNGCDNDYPYPADVSYWDFVADAAAAVDYVAGRGDVDGSDVVLAGHSQGGQVVPFVAEASDAVTDVVLLAAPYRPVDELLGYQAALSRSLLEELGWSRAAIDAELAALDEGVALLAALRAGAEPEGTILDAPATFWAEWMDAGDQTPAAVHAHPGGVLVLQGDYDWNVPATEAEAFAADLDGRAGAQVTVLPQLTHPFVRITEPAWQEVGPEDIGRGVDEAALEALVTWLGR